MNDFKVFFQKIDMYLPEYTSYQDILTAIEEKSEHGIVKIKSKSFFMENLKYILFMPKDSNEIGHMFRSKNLDMEPENRNLVYNTAMHIFTSELHGIIKIPSGAELKILDDIYKSESLVVGLGLSMVKRELIDIKDIIFESGYKGPLGWTIK